MSDLSPPGCGYSTKQDEKRRCTIDALTKLYRLFTKLPYIPAECLMIPPEAGWTTINEAELRERGKNEAVVHILRHLPYLKQSENAEKWTIAPSTLHLNYAEGDMYDRWVEDDILQVPGHVIWLTVTAEKEGLYLLLDAQTWDAIEFRISGDNEELDYEASEAVPEDQKWSIQTRMPAEEYFDLWRHKFETLEFFLVPDPRQFRGTAEFFCKARDHLWEESLWAAEEDKNDEEYEPSGANTSDSSLSHEEDGGEIDNDSDDDDDADWETLLDKNEIEWLERDQTDNPFLPFGEFQSEEKLESQVSLLPGCRRSILFCNGVPGQEVSEPPGDHSNGRWQKFQRGETDLLMKIFVGHGWPCPQPSTSICTFMSSPSADIELDASGFDRSSCRSELVDFIQAHRARLDEYYNKQEEQELGAQSKKIVSLRHKLQKLLLQREVLPGEEEILQASELIDELSDTDYQERPIQQSKIIKVLRAIQSLDSIPSGSQGVLQDKVQSIPDRWEILQDKVQSILDEWAIFEDQEEGSVTASW